MLSMRGAVLFLLILLLGCVQRPVQLEGVEITEYQGEDLSSVNEFRENSIAGPQYINESDYRLQVYGLVETPKNYTYGEALSKYTAYSKVVRLDCVEGWSVNILWEGILVRDILADSDPKEEANTIIFHAYDGYTTSFPIEYFDDNDILMAYRMNNVTIPPERGYPFMLVAESKWGYKWIKWITGIEVSDDEGYRGYWESRGYSDTGDLNGSFFD